MNSYDFSYESPKRKRATEFYFIRWSLIESFYKVKQLVEKKLFVFEFFPYCITKKNIRRNKSFNINKNKIVFRKNELALKQELNWKKTNLVKFENFWLQNLVFCL